MTNDRRARAQRAEAMRKERERAERKQRNLITVSIVAVVIVLIAVAGFGISRMSAQNERATEVVAPSNMTDDMIVYEPASVPEGAAEDPVLVEVYEDLLCPGCASFELAPTQSGASNGDWLKQQADEGRIQLVFRPYSFLDEVGGSSNDYSKRSMNIALCALDENGTESFWTAKTALFVNQPSEGGAGPSDADLTSTLEDAGVTVSDECVRTGKFIPWIREQRELAQDDRNITGTPTVYIAGERVDGPEQNGRATVPQQDVMEAAIAAAEA